MDVNIIVAKVQERLKNAKTQTLKWEEIAEVRLFGKKVKTPIEIVATILNSENFTGQDDDIQTVKAYAKDDSGKKYLITPIFYGSNVKDPNEIFFGSAIIKKIKELLKSK